MQTELRLHMLGTGHATVSKLYNTCFAIEKERSFLLVDAGGGNGIVSQLRKAAIAWEDIHTMILTHAHSDHILGAVWVVRMIAQRMCTGSYPGCFTIFCHDEGAAALRTICLLTLQKKLTALFDSRILFRVAADGEEAQWEGNRLTFFDLHSGKMKQFGFLLEAGAAIGAQQRNELADTGKRNQQRPLRLACLGDEPFWESCRSYVEEADWLLSEAFCLYEHRDRYKPYEKHHSTVRDACELADRMRVKHLVLYHTEDDTMPYRKKLYLEEGARYYQGKLFVPDDLEVIALEAEAYI